MGFITVVPFSEVIVSAALFCLHTVNTNGSKWPNFLLILPEIQTTRPASNMPA